MLLGVVRGVVGAVMVHRFLIPLAPVYFGLPPLPPPVTSFLNRQLVASKRCSYLKAYLPIFLRPQRLYPGRLQSRYQTALRYYRTSFLNTDRLQ